MKKVVNVFNKTYCAKHTVDSPPPDSAINSISPGWRCSPTYVEHHDVVPIKVTYPASSSSATIRTLETPKAKPVSQFKPLSFQGMQY
jgi:hypothetical protein